MVTMVHLTMLSTWKAVQLLHEILLSLSLCLNHEIVCVVCCQVMVVMAHQTMLQTPGAVQVGNMVKTVTPVKQPCRLS